MSEPTSLADSGPLCGVLSSMFSSQVKPRDILEAWMRGRTLTLGGQTIEIPSNCQIELDGSTIRFSPSAKVKLAIGTVNVTGVELENRLFPRWAKPFLEGLPRVYTIYFDWT